MHELLERISLGFREHTSLKPITWVCKNMHMLLLTRKKKAEKLSSYIATYSDESVNLKELSLKLHFVSWKEPSAVRPVHQELLIGCGMQQL